MKKSESLTPDSHALFMQLPILHSIVYRQLSPSNAKWNILGEELGTFDGLFKGLKLGMFEFEGKRDGITEGNEEGFEELFGLIDTVGFELGCGVNEGPDEGEPENSILRTWLGLEVSSNVGADGFCIDGNSVGSLDGTKEGLSEESLLGL